MYYFNLNFNLVYRGSVYYFTLNFNIDYRGVCYFELYNEMHLIRIVQRIALN